MLKVMEEITDIEEWYRKVLYTNEANYQLFCYPD